MNKNNRHIDNGHEEKLPDVLANIGRNDGMTVPEGYFADFASRMEGILPLNLEAEAPERAMAMQKRSLWSRVRPYVYMAAMFAGVFCMTKMFGLMGQTDNLDMRVDRNPVMIAALSDQDFMEDYIESNIDQERFYDDIYASGMQASDFNEMR